MQNFQSQTAQASHAFVDVTEDDGFYNIEMDLPGFERNDIQVQVQNAVLSVSAVPSTTQLGVVVDDREIKKKFFKYFERLSNNPIKTTVSLPPDVDQDNIVANLKDGVLRLRCPIRDHGAKEQKKICLSQLSSESYPFAK